MIQFPAMPPGPNTACWILAWSAGEYGEVAGLIAFITNPPAAPILDLEYRLGLEMRCDREYRLGLERRLERESVVCMF